MQRIEIVINDNGVAQVLSVPKDVEVLINYTTTDTWAIFGEGSDNITLKNF